MSATTEVKGKNKSVDVEKHEETNGDLKHKKASRKDFPITETEAELRSFNAGEAKLYECMFVLPEGSTVKTLSDGRKVLYAYTCDFNPQGAITRACIKWGASARLLDRATSPDKVYGELMALPPEHLKELLARVASNSHLANENPTGNTSRKK